jgi:hypothetical protein
MLYRPYNTRRSIAAVSYREEILAMMKAGTLDEED